MQQTLACPYFQKAFGWCVPIGALGGLIGLGGGEFRLPVLMKAIGFDVRSAIPVNLLISFVTLAFAMAARSHFVSVSALTPYLPAIFGLIGGGMISAVHGAGLVQRLASKHLVQIVALLLGSIGLLLLVETAFPFQQMHFLPPEPIVHFVTGFALGIGIGLVSSMLGVAGGELLIPALIFVFGADIRAAGSASILVSLCLIAAGLWRYWRLDAIPRGRGIKRITTAMALGSILGAGLGGVTMAAAPVGLLKLFLGTVLIAAAVKTMATHR